MKAAIGRTVARVLTSVGVRDARRGLASMQRKARGRPAVVHYFHQADDPYSHLLLQVLPALAADYQIQVVLHLAPPPGDAAAPDRERLQAWSRRDAEGLAAATGLAFVDPGHQPDPATASQANRALTAAFNDDTPFESALSEATAVGNALWRGEQATLERLAAAATTEQAAALLDAGAALRSKLGHYLGATLYFEGEWYWGVDRLGHLEQRLRSAGLARTADQSAIVALPRVACRHRPTNGHHPDLHFFCSLRSPYTYLAVARVRQLADCYDARLLLRFVLPMVMRGLPVPRDKRLYILRDAKREAESLGLPFGRVVDPVGVPTERGLAVLHHAIAAGKGPQFLDSFMRGVWSEGIDAGSDDGLRSIAARAAMDEASVVAALGDSTWRAVAQANREDMLARGLWGVPSFRVDGNPARWGQDRLWQIEGDLIAATQATPLDRP
jgi:2-hydroxychromene-2-carboxylate isomerase